MEKEFIADVVPLPGLKKEVRIDLIGADQMWELVLNDASSPDEMKGLAARLTQSLAGPFKDRRHAMAAF